MFLQTKTKERSVMKRFKYTFIAFVTVLTLSAAIRAQTLVDDWGRTPQGSYWPILNDALTPAGEASIAGTVPINGAGQATLRGGFDTLNITADTAVVVTGKIELVGTVGAEDSYNPLRFAIAFHPDDTLNYALTDSARWVRSPGWGYIFTPRTGAGVVANGTWGTGTVGVLNNGNWHSTNSNGGPALATILQAPRNAEMIPGIYNWAISVHQVNDTTNEIRWYLIEEENQYWYGGIVTGPASTDKFNAINFVVNTGDWTQVKLTEVSAGLGDPIVIPEAPWEKYFIDQWGETTQGRYWVIQNNSSTLVGDGSIKGDAPINGAGQASIRGGFGQELQIKADEALIVTGELELVGTVGAEDSYNPLRFAISYNENDTLRYALTDSAYWVRSPGFGYIWCPRTGAGVVANGTWGTGTVGVLNNGNWHSTNSNGGPALATILQAPRNAEMTPGTYDWSISVHQVNDTTNEIRWYLIKQYAAGEQSDYWFGGIVTGPAVTDKLTGVSFNVNTGDWTELKVIEAEVDYGDPIDIPAAPWEEFYIPVANWGFFGSPTNRIGGWTLTPGTLDGNVSISGTGPVTADQWASIRGGFVQDVLLSNLPADTALVITGELEFVGGGFDGWSGLRFGVFHTDSAGVVDTTTDGIVWTGSEGYSSGYLFAPNSGTNDNPTWLGPGGTGSVGGVINATWLSTNGANNYILSDQKTTDVAGAGTYEFKLSFQSMGNGQTAVGYSIKGSSYTFEGSTTDNHDPLATEKFNSINFAVSGTNTTTTALNITNVLVDLGSPIIVGVNGDDNLMPVVYS